MRPTTLGVRIAFFAFFIGTASLLAPVDVEAKHAPPPASTTIDPPGSLELTVVDETTGEPIPWANLIRVDESGGWLAGEDGVVRLAVVAPGTLRVQAVHLAYEVSAGFDLLIESGRTTRRSVAIAPRTLPMPTVEIRADRQTSVRQVASGVRKIHAEEGAALPNPKDDVFQMIRVLPGASAEDVGSEFHLRGGGIDETLVRIDGMEVENLLHGRDLGGITGILPYAVVQSMDVYPSAFPARYGGRLSGAIDIDLRNSGEAGVHGLFAADAISARALTEAHGANASLIVSAREGYLDRVLDTVQDEAVIHPAYRDFLVRSVYHPDPTRTVSVNYLRSEDRLFYEDGVELHFVDADYLDQYFWTSWAFTPVTRFSLTGTVHGTSSEQKRRVEGNGRDDQVARRVGGAARAEVADSGKPPAASWRGGRSGVG